MTDRHDLPERDAMEFDVVIVGAGPAGLSAAIRLKEIANAEGRELSVVVLEKGSEVGAHILSGAVVDPIALDRLVPDWREDPECPVKVKVTAEVLGEERGPKIVIQKFKNKTGYKKRQGHRQDLTRVKVTGIK